MIMWEMFVFATLAGLFGIVLYELIEDVRNQKNRMHDRYHE